MRLRGNSASPFHYVGPLSPVLAGYVTELLRERGWAPTATIVHVRDQQMRIGGLYPWTAQLVNYTLDALELKLSSAYIVQQVRTVLEEVDHDALEALWRLDNEAAEKAIATYITGHRPSAIIRQ